VHTVEVCFGTACRARGARLLIEKLTRESPSVVQLRVVERPCIGCCDLAPALIEDGHLVGHVTTKTLCEELHRLEAG
jgi:NADH:ubiquinone oxidoreductase subunit E